MIKTISFQIENDKKTSQIIFVTFLLDSWIIPKRTRENGIQNETAQDFPVMFSPLHVNRDDNGIYLSVVSFHIHNHQKNLLIDLPISTHKYKFLSVYVPQGQF